MPRVDINGNIVDFPDNLTPDQLNEAVSAAAGQLGSAQPNQPAAPQQSGLTGFLERNSLPLAPDAGFLNRKTKYLTVPEKLLSQGAEPTGNVTADIAANAPKILLDTAAALVPGKKPTGNLPLDIAANTPRILAESAKEMIPGYVSRGAILTAGGSKVLGAAAPLVKAGLRGIGSQAESMSGIAPRAEGALEAAYKDSSLIFGKGKKAAGPLYEAAKRELEHVQEQGNLFRGMRDAGKIFDKATQYVDKGGVLEPAEALMARKAADALRASRTQVPDEILRMRNVFDGMAKESSSIAKADPMVRRGIMAEALRKLAPQNKLGGASAFKSGIGAALAQMPGGKLLAATLLSPAFQGAAATGAGLVGRYAAPLAANPGSAVALQQLGKTLMNLRKKK